MFSKQYDEKIKKKQYTLFFISINSFIFARNNISIWQRKEQKIAIL